MTLPNPTPPATLEAALTELSLVKSELERWRRLANQKIQEKQQLEFLNKEEHATIEMLSGLVKELASALGQATRWQSDSCIYDDVLQRAKEATQ